MRKVLSFIMTCVSLMHVILGIEMLFVSSDINYGLKAAISFCISACLLMTIIWMQDYFKVHPREAGSVSKNEHSGNLCDNCNHRGSFFDESINKWKCCMCKTIIT